MKYLLILLFLVGCSTKAKYQLGDKVKSGNCIGIIYEVNTTFWPFEPRYRLLSAKCKDLHIYKLKVIESEIEKVVE